MIGSRERKAKLRGQYVRASYYAGEQMERMATHILNFGKYAQVKARRGEATDFSLMRHGIARLGCLMDR